jgi:hypothetical protein
MQKCKWTAARLEIHGFIAAQSGTRRRQRFRLSGVDQVKSQVLAE